ncbi:MAG: hypothetical protein AMXMBFR84_19310 [Candidatus Hydrogenedentota bacterium]
MANMDMNTTPRSHSCGLGVAHTVARYVAAWVVFLLGIATLAFAQDTRKLNNFVSELGTWSQSQADSKVSFTTPADGWLLIRVVAKPDTHVQVVDEGNILVNEARPEAMVWKAKDTYVLQVLGDGARQVSVRTIPELHYCRYPAQPSVAAYGSYDWPFLERHVLPHVNTIVGNPADDADNRIDPWIRTGRKWIGYAGLPLAEGLSADNAYRHWAENPGFTDPRLSGVIVDEFQGRQNPLYPAWTESLARLGSNPVFTGKKFYGYCGGPGMYSRPQTRSFVNTVIEKDYRIAWLRYLHEMPTHAAAETQLQTLLTDEMVKWRATFPGVERHMILVSGLFTSALSLNVQPQVSYKAWMDMQVRHLATDPAFQGLSGLQWWTSQQADEEILRWMAALFRHYALEGRTDSLAEAYGYAYELPHLTNPDFDAQLDGWTANTAETGTITSGYMEHLGRLQGRYWHRAIFPDEPAGNAFALLRRSTRGPNRISQPVRSLKPGQLYSLKVIAADYGDLSAGLSEEKEVALRIDFTGAEPVPGKSFVTRYNSASSATTSGPFTGGKVAWFTLYRQVFRATREIGELTISDWKSDSEAGGATGQEIAINFVELEPYYDADAGDPH